MTFRRVVLFSLMLAAVAAGVWFSMYRKSEEPKPAERQERKLKKGTKAERRRLTRTQMAQVIASSKSDPVYTAVMRMIEEDISLDDEKSLTDEIRKVLSQMSQDELKLVRMNLLMNRGDKSQVLKVARDLMDSGNPETRRLVAQAFGWIGATALPELTQMIKDSDPAVVQEVLEKWETIFDNISTEELSATMLFELLPVLESRELIHCALMSTTKMNLRNGLETVSGVIEENSGNALLQEVAREMWTHLTGGEEYQNAESVNEHMERRAKEEKEAIMYWRKIRAAQEAGDIDRLNELLGYDVRYGRKHSAGSTSGEGTDSATGASKQ